MSLEAEKHTDQLKSAASDEVAIAMSKVINGLAIFMF